MTLLQRFKSLGMMLSLTKRVRHYWYDLRACSNRIEKVLNKAPGVKDATVNLTTEQAMVTYYPGQTDLDTLIGRIRNLGYDA